MYQDSQVVSHKAKKKQHAHAQLTWLPVCYLQLPMLWNFQVMKFSCLEHYLLVIIKLVHSYHVESVKPKMNELSATIVKNQPFWLLWYPFPYLRLKLDCLENNSIVARELIPLFYVESTNQHSIQFIQSPLLCGLQYSILQLKKILSGRLVLFYFYFRNLCVPR